MTHTTHSTEMDRLTASIESCSAAIIEYEAYYAAATYRSRLPAEGLHSKLEACFYLQEIRELKQWRAAKVAHVACLRDSVD